MQTRSLIHYIHISLHSHKLSVSSLLLEKRRFSIHNISPIAEQAQRPAGNFKALIQAYTRLKSCISPGKPLALLEPHTYLDSH